MITMRQIVPFSAFIAGTLFLTGCATSSNLINDDVYSVKEVEVPIGTDITDETDYSAYVYNKEKTERNNTYYDQFNRNQNNMMPYSSQGFRPRMSVGMGFGYGSMAYGNPYYSPFYSPYYGYYDPYGRYYGNYYSDMYSPYNTYGQVGNPYGYSPYGYGPYGVNYYPSYGYGSGYGSSGSSHASNVIIGKRGSSSGMGGVNSRPGNSVKSASAFNPGNGKGPVIAPTPGRTTVSRPVTNSAVAGRTTSGSPAVSSSSPTRPGRVVSTQTQSPARPNQTANSGNSGISGRTPSTRVESQSRPSQTISTPSRSIPSSSGGGSRPSGGMSGGTSRPAPRR